MAYLTARDERQQVKRSVFERIAPGQSVRRIGRELYEVAARTVHARFCALGAGGYKFNINPNTLRAEYELWICDSSELWYLIPIYEIATMYRHPTAYPDYHHPDIRVLSVDAIRHRVKYAAPNVSLDVKPYLRALLR